MHVRFAPKVTIGHHGDSVAPAGINVVEKEKLRVDVSVGDGTSGKVQLFSRINPAPIKAWRLRLGHLLPRRRESLSFVPAAFLGAWLGLRIFRRPIQPAVNLLLIASGVGLIV
jgi:hypothetical protein